MDQDCNPAQHPQARCLLWIARVNPRKERHQDGGYSKDDNFFKPRRHKAAFLLPFLPGGAQEETGAFRLANAAGNAACPVEALKTKGTTLPPIAFINDFLL